MIPLDVAQIYQSCWLGSWSSLAEGGEGSYLPNFETNLVIALVALSLLFCIIINTTAYHLGRYKPSSFISCRTPSSDTTNRELSPWGSIDVQLTSCLTGLDSVKQVKLLLIQHKQSRWIQNQINTRLAIQWYFPCYDIMWSMSQNFFGENFKISNRALTSLDKEESLAC